jgi:nitroreductase/NAD-dependent dihydropyrimidine dehydrogenase PreA subunit
MSGFAIHADPVRCTLCGDCESVCPSGVFSFISDTVEVHHPGRCITCGHCVAVCAEDALRHSNIPDQKFDAYSGESLVHKETLRQLFMRRRSCRSFQEKPLGREQIDGLIDQARYAPTSTNSENVRYLVFSEEEGLGELSEWTARYYLKLDRQLRNPLVRFAIGLAVGQKTVKAYRYHMPAIQELFQHVVNGEDKLFYGAPAVIVALASGLSHIALASCNLAAMELLLACETNGLGACYNGYTLTALTRDKKMRRRVGIPTGYTPGAVIAIGYPKHGFVKIPPRRKRRVLWYGD